MSRIAKTLSTPGRPKFRSRQSRGFPFKPSFCQQPNTPPTERRSPRKSSSAGFRSTRFPIAISPCQKRPCPNPALIPGPLSLTRLQTSSPISRASICRKPAVFLIAPNAPRRGAFSARIALGTGRSLAGTAAAAGGGSAGGAAAVDKPHRHASFSGRNSRVIKLSLLAFRRPTTNRAAIAADAGRSIARIAVPLAG